MKATRNNLIFGQLTLFFVLNSTNIIVPLRIFPTFVYSLLLVPLLLCLPTQTLHSNHV
jgi:hypothetical protein